MNIQAPQKNFLVKATIVLPIILAIIFAGIYFNLSGIFRDVPKVEIKPLNNFKKTLHVVTDSDYAPYSYSAKAEGDCGFSWYGICASTFARWKPLV